MKVSGRMVKKGADRHSQGRDLRLGDRPFDRLKVRGIHMQGSRHIKGRGLAGEFGYVARDGSGARCAGTWQLPGSCYLWGQQAALQAALHIALPHDQRRRQVHALQIRGLTLATSCVSNA